VRTIGRKHVFEGHVRARSHHRCDPCHVTQTGVPDKFYGEISKGWREYWGRNSRRLRLGVLAR